MGKLTERLSASRSFVTVATSLLLASGFLAEGLVAQAKPKADAAAQAVLPSPVLSPSKIKSLQKLLRGWYKSDVTATDKQNEARSVAERGNKRKAAKLRKDAAKLRKKARKSKAKFRDMFEKEGSRSGTLLKHVPDMLAIFDGCFPYPKQSNGGVVKTMKLRAVRDVANAGYAVRFPSGYKPFVKSYPLLLVLPDKQGNKKWPSSKKWLETAWPKTVAAAYTGYIIAVPNLPADMELDQKVDPLSDKAEAGEMARRRYVLQTLGDLFINFQIDTDRVFLQASGSSVPFAMRLVSTFPDRFAAVVLENPPTSEVDDSTIFQNFEGIGVLFVANAASKKAATELLAAFQGAGVQDAKIIEASGTPPFAAKCQEKVDWLAKQRRNLFRQKFTLIPANDRFRKAYWVDIEGADYLAQIPSIDDRPRLEVSVDRAANKISITGHRVTKVRVYLNDLLVDLDKKVTFFLNGEVREAKFGRSLALVANASEGLVVRRNDPRFVFVRSTVLELPAPKEDKADKGESGDGSGGDSNGAGK